MMGTPSAQTLDDLSVSQSLQELEEVPMTMVGGLDVHRQQITFDYVDDDGLVHWGQIGSDPPGDAANVAALAGRALR